MDMKSLYVGDSVTFEHVASNGVYVRLNGVIDSLDSSEMAMIRVTTSRLVGRLLSVNVKNILWCDTNAEFRGTFKQLVWPGDAWGSSGEVVVAVILDSPRIDITVTTLKNHHHNFYNLSYYTPPGTASVSAAESNANTIDKLVDAFKVSSPVVDCTCDTKMLVSYGCQCDYSKRKRGRV